MCDLRRHRKEAEACPLHFEGGKSKTYPARCLNSSANRNASNNALAVGEQYVLKSFL